MINFLNTAAQMVAAKQQDEAAKDYSEEMGTGSKPDTGEIFYRPHCMGIWLKWQEFYQDDAECRQDA